MDLYNTPLPIDDYCHAIGYNGPLSDDLRVITALARGQLMNIPFENLDVLSGKEISLQPQDIVDKLLYSARGGYCYELNGLFAMVLHHLQVPHTLALARPMFYSELRPRTHMVIIAYLNNALHLIDVGFGSYGPRTPIDLKNLEQTIEQDNEKFRLDCPQEGEFVLSAMVGDQWQAQYGFNLGPQLWIDFVPANYFNSTSPNSLFTQKAVVLIHTPQGRNILFGDQLKVIEGDAVETRTVPDSQRNEVLREYFGIEA